MGKRSMLVALPFLVGCGSSAAAAPEIAQDDSSRPGPSALSNPDQTSVSLRVIVRGFENRKGQVLIALYTSAKGFPDDGDAALRRVALPVPAGRVEHVFSGLRAGTYAVAVLHDENKNFKMDTSLFGMPREAYGVSNNAQGRFGPPSFGDAAIELHPGKKHRASIKLIYP